jgi:pimeloyl-ACP methyl ester carboxylesterase
MLLACKIVMLMDYRLERYSWRADAEERLNTSLPQYRTTITPKATHDVSDVERTSLRVHFVHKRSANPEAIPLLWCHGWPCGILEVEKILNDLTNPDEDGQAFHLVAPSLPGFGFSDASAEEGMGLKETSWMFDLLMKKLGYMYYVAHGSGW